MGPATFGPNPFVKDPVELDKTTAYIGIGSNLGDRAGNLILAVRGLMEASFEVTKLSAIYETDPVEIADGPRFLNMTAEIQVTSVSSSQMMARMLRIEYLLGRREKSLMRPRTIDLDLLFFGAQRLKSPFLTVPHPRLHLRRFVLTPLAEIAPYFRHPVLNKSVVEMLEQCDDLSAVTRWNPNTQTPSRVSNG